MKTAIILAFFSCENTVDRKSKAEQVAQPQYYTISNEKLRLEIDPGIGGRVASMKVDGHELLKVSRDKEHLQWGSTVWPAPQKNWNWPPPPVLDRHAYDIIEDSESCIKVRSKKDPQTNLQITKQFSIKSENEILVKYYFKNTGKDTLRVGIWENTRVPFQGHCFVPAEKGEIIEPLKKYNSAYSKISFNQQLQKPNKLQISGYKGRMVYFNDRVVFIKKFDHLPSGRIAPDQSLIEIYYDPTDKFVELEVHGPFEELKPGEIATMKLIWEFVIICDSKDINRFLN